MIGQTLGHYRIVEKIGEGGMGVVYRACDERLNRDVALKLLPAGMLADSAALKSFREEAQALSKLNHPNIATVHDFDVQDRTSFLVMEYIPGNSLDQKIAAGAVPEKEVIRLGTQLAQGLQAAHSKGIVHRDLKPSNLRVTPDRRLKILDFGLALFSEPTDQNATQTSLDIRPLAGTLPYMAPEQLQGQPADQRSDIYAAGAILYEMTTGQRLFPDKHGTRLVEAILHRSPQLPRDLNARVSPELQGIIQKALDKDPERRYQSARELQVDLQRMSISASPIPPAAIAEPTGPLPLEIAHVLFMDIAAYSKLPMDQQKRLLEELQKTVRGSREFVRAKSHDTLISLPSGDGMALVFFSDPESPCRCALEVSRLLRSRSEINLRMGIHTGPVYRIADINANRNVAGGGINLAQRVMDCGDAGHILISQAVADVLSQISGWNGSLHDLGEAEVKHGARIHLFNLYTDDAGNPKLPEKLAGKSPTHKSDPGKRVRSSARSGVRPKNRSGVKTAAEIRAESTSEKPNEARTRQPEPGLLGKLHAAPGKRLASVLLAVLLLAVLALAVPLVPHRVKAAPPGVPPLAAGKFLAVLPFAVEGDASALQPIAEGLNQQLSAKLLALRDVSVTSARATAEDVDPRASLVTIGSSLGSNLVIRGTVRGDDKTMRITVNLDEVASGRRRFSQTFSGTRKELLALQDQVYTRILKDLELNPSAKEMERAAVRPTDNAEAYEIYNKGRSLYRGHPDVNKVIAAISDYEEGIKIDPNFALAHASLADASLWMYRETKDVIWISKATAAAQTAQKLDGNLREAHLSLGNVYRATGRTDAAMEEFIEASQLSPGSDDCYRRLGLAYLDAGKKTPALMALQNAVTLNPFYWNNYLELGNAYFQFGEYSKALASFKKVAEFEPSNSLGHQNIGAVYFQQGKYAESIPEFIRASELQSTDAANYSDLGEALLYLKRYSEALPYLEKSAQMKPNDQLIVGNLADGYRWTGEQKKSVDTYSRAISLANKDLAVNPRDTTALGSLAVYYAKLKKFDLAEHYIHRARSIDGLDVQLIYYEAIVFALADQPSMALDSLRLALDKGISPEQARLEPEFASLHSNPVFETLVNEFLEKSK